MQRITHVQLRPVDSWDTPLKLPSPQHTDHKYHIPVNNDHDEYGSHRVPTPLERPRIISTRRIRRPTHSQLRYRVIRPPLNDSIQGCRPVRIVDQLAVGDDELPCGVGIAEDGGGGSVGGFGAEVLVEVGVFLYGTIENDLGG